MLVPLVSTSPVTSWSTVQSPRRYRLNSADQPQDHLSRCGVV